MANTTFAKTDAARPLACVAPARSTCDASVQSIAVTRPSRPGTIGPLPRNPTCRQSLNVWMGGAGAPDEGPATSPDPANEASTTRVHVAPGCTGSSETPRPGAPSPPAMKPVET